jgi:mRNA-degrading endonuclease RelE of RelBE toxin-antitoxin system
MAWTIEWSAPAIVSLRRIPWRVGARVDAAVQRLARTGEGEVVQLATDTRDTVRLRVGVYFVRITFDQWQGVARVWSVYRR